MKMRVKPLVVDVIEDDGMWLDASTMTYYDKDSLNQIDKSEVDLEKEIDKKAQELHITPCYDELKNFARHFYELGLNARKEN